MAEAEERTYYQLREIYGGDNSNPELGGLKLECSNCGHLGTVDEMRVLKNPKNQHPFFRDQILRNKNLRRAQRDGKLSLRSFPSYLKFITEYDERFKCPNCDSTSVRLLPEELDKVVAQAL